MQSLLWVPLWGPMLLLLLVVGCWSLVLGSWFLVLGSWLLVVGCCLLLVACWLLLVACCLLLVACCLLLVAGCLLLVACCLLLVACCVLRVACCVLCVVCCVSRVACMRAACAEVVWRTITTTIITITITITITIAITITITITNVTCVNRLCSMGKRRACHCSGDANINASIIMASIMTRSGGPPSPPPLSLWPVCSGSSSSPCVSVFVFVCSCLGVLVCV